MRPAHAWRVIAIAIGLLAVFVSSGALAQEITKGPWFFNVATTSARIAIETSQPTEASVTLTDAQGASFEVSLETSARGDRTRGPALGSARVRGLSSNVRYQVSVKLGEDESSGEFVTAPPMDTEISFLVYGDVRSDHRAHARVVRAMLEEEDARFVLHTGDFVEVGGRPADWVRHFEIAGPLLRQTALLPTLGNHELYGPGGRAAYARHFLPPDRRRAYYARNYGAVRVISLDSNDDWHRGCDQESWLRRTLDEGLSGTRFNVVVVHHGLTSSGLHGSHEGMRAAGVFDLLREHDIDLVVAGHDHMYERGDDEGLKYVVSGGGGAPLYRVNRELDAQLAFVPVHHYLRVRTDENALMMDVVLVDGTLLEECRLVQGSPWECGDGGASGPVDGGISETAFYLERRWPWVAIGVGIFAVILIAIWRRRRASR